MKNYIKYSLSAMAIAMTGWFGACTDIKVEAPEIPNLPTVTNLTATVDNRVVTLTWNLPTSSLEIEGVTVKVNNNNEIGLDAGTTSYKVYGQPMEDEYLYTVKVRYKDGYVSEGQSVIATVPFEQLAELTSFTVTNLEKRNVSFAWSLPAVSGVSGVWVGLDGEDSGTVFPISEYPNGGTLTGQKTGVDLKFRAKVVYDEAYYSNGVVVNTALPEMEVRAGFLLLADSPADLPDDDELAAAAWFSDNYVDTDKGDFINVSELGDIDFDEYGMIMIMVDRVGLEYGWENLPANLVAPETLDLLRAYGANGGNLYLAKMATQLTVPLNVVPADMGPTIWSSGEGGAGDDIWTINPYLGWDFKDGGDQEFYDRTDHAIFQGITLEQVNDYPYASIPLEGPGFREDHNTMWDCNIYGNGGMNNVILHFETVTNSLVLATWGHVRDHCVAGLVVFNKNTEHGTVVANGFSAYEFNQNSGANPYQGNVEKLTANIIEYLK
ncbi:MAG: DUF4960 domain-containing protein [Muribaculaceae bacterium]|nr:DUF4960 domain-containing protein [Muribaculaceae bacterium]